MADIHLVRDVLDGLLLDSAGRRCGRVDGLVLAIEHNRPPRVVAIEAGGVAAARRLWGPLRRLLIRLARHYGRTEPVRIAWEHVNETGLTVTLDFNAGRSRLLYWEAQAQRIVGRIPGS